MIIIQSFLVGDFGVNYTVLEIIFAEDSFQYGLGMGAITLIYAYLMLFANGIALKGFMKGDVFAVTCLVVIVFLVLVFVFFPVFNILIRAFWETDTGYSLSIFGA
jgi:iron(III) transport system permease protein